MRGYPGLEAAGVTAVAVAILVAAVYGIASALGLA